jgi:hypothetical protein
VRFKSAKCLDVLVSPRPAEVPALDEWKPGYPEPKPLDCIARDLACGAMFRFGSVGVWSLAFIGNAAVHNGRGAVTEVGRGVFDKETRRKPLAFAADATYGD